MGFEEWEIRGDWIHVIREQWNNNSIEGENNGEVLVSESFKVTYLTPWFTISVTNPNLNKIRHGSFI